MGLEEAWQEAGGGSFLLIAVLFVTKNWMHCFHSKIFFATILWTFVQCDVFCILFSFSLSSSLFFSHSLCLTWSRRKLTTGNWRRTPEAIKSASRTDGHSNCYLNDFCECLISIITNHFQFKFSMSKKIALKIASFPTPTKGVNRDLTIVLGLIRKCFQYWLKCVKNFINFNFVELET